MRPTACFHARPGGYGARALALLGVASALSVVSVSACSFEWDDYRTQASGGSSTSTASGAGGSGASSSGGSGGDCTSSQKLCGGQCVSVDDPDYGCAPTGCEPCSVPNATAACSGGACTFGECMPGYGDCDDVPGCETSTTTSPQHCGGCNIPCPGTSCVNGMCGSESCINGVDDDDDGMIDCADDDCVTFECVVVQSPWKGPVFLYDGPYATKPSDCSTLPGSNVYEGFDGLMFSPASCSGCSCGSPTVSCALAPLQAYSDAMCAGTLLSSNPQPPPPTCGAVGGTAILGVKAAAPAASGSCAPAGGSLILDPYTWDTAALACQPIQEGGGCSGQGVCVGNAPASFGPKPCIYRNGDQPCPAGFGEKHVFHDGASDSRGCSACQCSVPPGTGSCTASSNVSTQAGCTGTTADVPNNNSCVPVSAAASMSTMVTTTNGFGACNASGGAPVGTVEESGTTTVCCMP